MTFNNYMNCENRLTFMQEKYKAYRVNSKLVSV